MDFLAALADEAPPQTRGKCKLQRWLDTEARDYAGRDEFIAALSNRDRKSEDYRTNSKLLRVIKRMGLDICDRTLAEHRRLDCKCGD